MKIEIHTNRPTYAAAANQSYESGYIKNPAPELNDTGARARGGESDEPREIDL